MAPAPAAVGTVLREPPPWEPDRSDGWRIRGMAVVPSHRGRGIGERKLEELADVDIASRAECGDDGVDVVDAAAPGAAADLLERGPEARVIGEIGIRGEVGARRARGEHARAFLG